MIGINEYGIVAALLKQKRPDCNFGIVNLKSQAVEFDFKLKSGSIRANDIEFIETQFIDLVQRCRFAYDTISISKVLKHFEDQNQEYKAELLSKSILLGTWGAGSIASKEYFGDFLSNKYKFPIEDWLEIKIPIEKNTVLST